MVARAIKRSPFLSVRAHWSSWDVTEEGGQIALVESFVFR